MTSKTVPPIALWNPLWINVWSFLFSPILGSILIRANWSEMGKTLQSESSSYWTTIGLLLLFLYLVAEPWLPASEFADYYFWILWLGFYFSWLFISALPHYKYVKQTFGTNYHHKLWGKPLMLGAAGLLLWMALSLTYIVGLLAMGVLDPNTIDLQ